MSEMPNKKYKNIATILKENCFLILDLQSFGRRKGSYVRPCQISCPYPASFEPLPCGILYANGDYEHLLISDERPAMEQESFRNCQKVINTLFS